MCAERHPGARPRAGERTADDASADDTPAPCRDAEASPAVPAARAADADRRSACPAAAAAGRRAADLPDAKDPRVRQAAASRAGSGFQSAPVMPASVPVAARAWGAAAVPAVPDRCADLLREAESSGARHAPSVPGRVDAVRPAKQEARRRLAVPAAVRLRPVPGDAPRWRVPLGRRVPPARAAAQAQPRRRAPQQSAAARER